MNSAVSMNPEHVVQDLSGLDKRVRRWEEGNGATNTAWVEFLPAARLVDNG